MGLEKNNGAVTKKWKSKPAPDFNKLHQKWQSKFEHGKANAKKPCTVASEFDFSQDVLKHPSKTAAVRSNENSEIDERLKVPLNMIDAKPNTPGSSSKRKQMEGDESNKRSRKILGALPCDPKQVKTKSNPKPVDKTPRRQLSNSHRVPGRHKKSCVEEQKECGNLQFEKNKNALKSILENKGINDENIDPQKTPSRHAISLCNQVTPSPASKLHALRNSIYYQPASRKLSLREACTDNNRIPISRLRTIEEKAPASTDGSSSLSSKENTGKVPESPLFGGVHVVPDRQSIYFTYYRNSWVHPVKNCTATPTKETSKSPRPSTVNTYHTARRVPNPDFKSLAVPPTRVDTGQMFSLTKCKKTLKWSEILSSPSTPSNESSRNDPRRDTVGRIEERRVLDYHEETNDSSPENIKQLPKVDFKVKDLVMKNVSDASNSKPSGVCLSPKLCEQIERSKVPTSDKDKIGETSGKREQHTDTEETVKISESSSNAVITTTSYNRERNDSSLMSHPLWFSTEAQEHLKTLHIHSGRRPKDLQKGTLRQDETLLFVHSTTRNNCTHAKGRFNSDCQQSDFAFTQNLKKTTVTSETFPQEMARTDINDEDRTTKNGGNINHSKTITNTHVSRSFDHNMNIVNNNVQSSETIDNQPLDNQVQRNINLESSDLISSAQHSEQNNSNNINIQISDFSDNASEFESGFSIPHQDLESGERNRNPNFHSEPQSITSLEESLEDIEIEKELQEVTQCSVNNNSVELDNNCSTIAASDIMNAQQINNQTYNQAQNDGCNHGGVQRSMDESYHFVKNNHVTHGSDLNNVGHMSHEFQEKVRIGGDFSTSLSGQDGCEMQIGSHDNNSQGYISQTDHQTTLRSYGVQPSLSSYNLPHQRGFVSPKLGSEANPFVPRPSSISMQSYSCAAEFHRSYSQSPPVNSVVHTLITPQPKKCKERGDNTATVTSVVPPIWTPMALKGAAVQQQSVFIDDPNSTCDSNIALQDNGHCKYTDTLCSEPSMETLNRPVHFQQLQHMQSGVDMSAHHIQGTTSAFQCISEGVDEEEDLGAECSFSDNSAFRVLRHSGSSAFAARGSLLRVTEERFQETLIDDECALYASNVRATARELTPSGIRACTDPVARVLMEGDDMHFLPIEDQQLPLKRDNHRSAFSAPK